MKEKPSIFEWVVFWVFIFLQLVVFLLRIFSPATEVSQLENVLLSTFEIVFSLYVGYFIQRLDSMKQFQESLKQYGLSAYRRIMDIRKSVDRTITQIDRISVNYPKDKTSDIEVLRLILEGTFDTVESSVADWGDIIGQEIRKKERAELIHEELTKSQERLNLNADDKKNIEELKRELNKINAELPLALKSDSIGKEVEQKTREFYARYFEFHINKDGCMTLYIKPNFPVSEKSARSIIERQPFFFYIMENVGIKQCLVYDNSRTEIGQVVNPITPYEPNYYLSELQTAFVYFHLFDNESPALVFKVNNFRYAGLIYKELIIREMPVKESYAPHG